MKRALSTVFLGSLFAVALAAPALAFDNTKAAIALHIAAPTSKNQCDLPGITAATVQVTQPVLSTPAGPFYFAYLLVCNGSDSTGIRGVEYGINYQGGHAPAGGAFPISVFSWSLCGDLEFPASGYPAPGGSNIVTWTAANCQDTPTEGTRYTVIAVAGYFYMGAYGPSQMFVTPRPVSGFAKVADCLAREDDITNSIPSHLGNAGFGGPEGYNPCGGNTPVQPSTWSGVKSLYNNR